MLAASISSAGCASSRLDNSVEIHQVGLRHDGIVEDQLGCYCSVGFISSSRSIKWTSSSLCRTTSIFGVEHAEGLVSIGSPSGFTHGGHYFVAQWDLSRLGAQGNHHRDLADSGHHTI